jgi:hypothetical protein
MGMTGFAVAHPIPAGINSRETTMNDTQKKAHALANALMAIAGEGEEGVEAIFAELVAITATLSVALAFRAGKSRQSAVELIGNCALELISKTETRSGISADDVLTGKYRPQTH